MCANCHENTTDTTLNDSEAGTRVYLLQFFSMPIQIILSAESENEKD